jgi:excisionase family DNA binding protein
MGNGGELMSDLVTSKPISITVKTARDMSGLSNTTVYELIKTGRIKTTKVGRRTLVIYSSLENLLNPEAGR